MTATSRGCASLLAAGAMLACGDPVIVQGDLPGIMRVVVGVAADQDPAVGPESTRTELLGPRGLAIAGDGRLYLTDAPARTVVEVASSGQVRVLLDHGGCSGPTCVSRPEAVALDGRGGVLVADPSAGRVWRIPLEGGAPVAIAGADGGEAPRPGADATTVTFQEPAGVVGGPDGAVYLSERGRHRVWRIERSGLLTAVAGTGSPGHRDGPAGTAQFRTPAGLAQVGSVLYVADLGNHRVRAISLERAEVTTVAGTGSAAYAGDDGPARGASLHSPEAVAVTADGTGLFVADKGNHRVRRITLTTGLITTFAGTGEPTFTGSGREAGTTALDSPTGVAVLGASFLFVSDNGNRLVWRTPIGL
jgi:DNA-binding beta-propeller fold protein YncE